MQCTFGIWHDNFSIFRVRNRLFKLHDRVLSINGKKCFNLNSSETTSNFANLNVAISKGDLVEFLVERGGRTKRLKYLPYFETKTVKVGELFVKSLEKYRGRDCVSFEYLLNRHLFDSI